MFGFFAGVYHWFPKLTGALLRERLGKLQLVLMVIGTNLTFFPMFFLGQDGMPRRISRYPDAPGLGDAQPARDDRRRDHRARRARRSWSTSWSRCAAASPPGDDPWLGPHARVGDHLAAAAAATSTAPLPPIRSYAPLLDLRQEASDRAPPRGGAGVRGGAIPLLAWGDAAARARSSATGSGTPSAVNGRGGGVRGASSIYGSACALVARGAATRSGAGAPRARARARGRPAGEPRRRARRRVGSAAILFGLAFGPVPGLLRRRAAAGRRSGGWSLELRAERAQPAERAREERR